MRGKAAQEAGLLIGVGITPAHAGKRNGQSPTMLLRRDHPRVCGEKNAILSGRKTEPGSPPRMRGKGRQLDVLVHGVRITPAYAGKRACTAVCSTNATGSPPRMRGKAFPQGVHVVVVGITPAYAGKSRFPGPSPALPRDHPRVCGEKPNRIIWDHWKEGSPPRMRGKENGTDHQSGQCLDHPRVCGEKAASTAIPSRGQGSPPRMRGKELVIRLV